MDYKEVNRKTYNTQVEYFTKKFGGRMDMERRKEFGTFLKLLKGNKILDLGCGSGDHALYFKQEGLEVKCVDISEELVKVCKSRGLDAQVMDIEELNFKDNSFDGIWAVSSLLHIPKNKMEEVISKLQKILKKEGIMYISIHKGEGEKFIPLEDNRGERFYSLWQLEEFSKLLEKYFAILEKEEVINGPLTHVTFFAKKLSQIP